MTPIEIHFDRGHGEKTLVLSPQRIGEGGADDLLASWHPDVVVFAANGADYAAPPFEKGAPVLRSIRSSSGQTCRDWKMLLPLAQSSEAFLRILPDTGKHEPKAVANWGIWVCESEDAPRFPHLLAVNFPLWDMRGALQGAESAGVAQLSSVYRAVLGAVDLFRACRLVPLRTLAMSDLGGNMLKTPGSGLQTTRIGVLGEVIGAWLAVSASTDRVVIAFHGDLAEAWNEHAGRTRDEEVEFGEAAELRKQNAGLCRRLAGRVNTSSALGSSLATRLMENADLFDGDTPSLLTDLTQSRTLAEALVVYFLEVNASGRKLPFEFDKKIEFMGEQCGVSAWIKSYLHTLRILGNEGAHTKNSQKRRPEQPVGRDLVVIHAALNRILNFAYEEFE
jgi:hypothetical protein